MLEPRSFDVCINAVVLIVVMLDYSEVDIEISDIGMETVEFDNCREMLINNRDANSMLAIIWEKAKFFYKDRQKFIDLFT